MGQRSPLTYRTCADTEISNISSIIKVECRRERLMHSGGIKTFGYERLLRNVNTAVK